MCQEVGGTMENKIDTIPDLVESLEYIPVSDLKYSQVIVKLRIPICLRTNEGENRQCL